MELHETPVETARRELWEETGLVGSGPRLGDTFLTYSTEVPYAHVPVYFDRVSGAPEVIPGERFSELEYFDMNDLPEPLFEPSSSILENLGRMISCPDDPRPPATSTVRIEMSLLPWDDPVGAGRIHRIWDPDSLPEAFSAENIPEGGDRVAGRSVAGLVEAVERLGEEIRSMIGQDLLRVVPDRCVDLHRIAPLPGGLGEIQLVSTSFLHRLLRDGEFRESIAHGCPPSAGEHECVRSAGACSTEHCMTGS